MTFFLMSILISLLVCMTDELPTVPVNRDRFASLFYYIAGLLSSWFVILFVRDIWSIVLKIYLVWWYDVLPVIKLDGRKEIPWRVSHQAEKAVERFPELGCFAVAVRRIVYEKGMTLDNAITMRSTRPFTTMR